MGDKSKMKASVIPTILLGFCLIGALFYNPFKPTARKASATDDGSSSNMRPLSRAEIIEKTQEVSSMLTTIQEWTEQLVEFMSNQEHFHEDAAAHEMAVKKNEEEAKLDEELDVQMEKKLDADGCYHVFIDVGASIGVQGRFLMEPEKYPDAENARYVFDRWFGPPGARDNRDFCIFAIEANPDHREALHEKSEAYKRMGWRYEYINEAASDHDGFMEFHHASDKEALDQGFSVKVSKHGSEKLPTFRLADWIKEHVGPRKMPEKVYGEYTNNGESHYDDLGFPKGGPKVVMKMDIEGSEYVVLPDLITTGAICELDFTYAEFHPRHAPFAFPANDKKGEFIIQNREHAKHQAKNLGKVINESRTCKARFKVWDDHKYPMDGVPLPIPHGDDRKD